MAGQHGVGDDNIAAAATDAGADVPRGVALAYDWEWCLAPLVNRATINGTGNSAAKAQSKNPNGHGLSEDIQGMVEHFNKSTGNKA